MKAYKENYLKQIRSNTAYPTYRGIVGVITFIGYLILVFYFLGSMGAGLNQMSYNPGMGILIIFFGIVVSVLLFFLVRFTKEVSLMIADMVDSTIDANSKPSDTPSQP